MPETPLLLVLSVRETGLRSALTAQLALSGANLITTDDVESPALLRGVRRPAVLVLDGAMADSRSPRWIESALDDLRWYEIVLLAAAEAQLRGHPKLLCLEPANAARQLEHHVPRWREACNQPVAG